MATSSTPSVEQLSRALSVVGELIDGIRDEQWSAPTPCTDWTVHRLVNHLIGMNLVFAALLRDQAPPERGGDRIGDDPIGAYRESGSVLMAAFDELGVLDDTFHGPLGTATGVDRLQIRLYDLLAHGWDLAQATGQSVELPNDLAEDALVFARVQLSTQPRNGRFESAQSISDDAPAIDRLVAFLGRPVSSV
jgi:uncharacterized protein (TIGR03086 family)